MLMRSPELSQVCFRLVDVRKGYDFTRMFMLMRLPELSQVCIRLFIVRLKDMNGLVCTC